jgi:hypothetical protein
MTKVIDQTRLEILKMARELVINEYVDRRAQEHNEWLDKSTTLWQTSRMKLAYPVIPPYPTENDIVNRAKTLLEFLITDSDNDEEIETLDDFNQEIKYEELDQENLNEELDTSMENMDTEIIETDPTNEEAHKANNKMPNIMKKIQNIREYLNDNKT